MAAFRADPQHDKSLYAHVGTPATPSASLWKCDEADEASGCFEPCLHDIMAQLTQKKPFLYVLGALSGWAAIGCLRKTFQ